MKALEAIIKRIRGRAEWGNYNVSELVISPKMLMVKVPITQWARGVDLLTKEAKKRGLIPTAIAFEMIVDKYPEAEVEIVFCGEH